MNMLYLMGRLTRDPEIKTVDGKKSSFITLAVKRQFKNPEGQYDTDFISCVLWNVIAERVGEFCKKGDLIAVKGRIQNDNYTDDDNNMVYQYQIIADQVSFIQSASKNKKNKEELVQVNE